MKEEDKDFEVVDKRGPREEPETQVEPEDEPDQEQPQRVADVYSLLRLFVAMLAENAWVWMGLRVDPMTRQINRDLEQARAAIDTLVFLIDKISLKAEEGERRELRSILSELQLNFVQQSAKGE